MLREMNETNKVYFHDCKALGKHTRLPRAYSEIEPSRVFYICPFCNYFIDEEIKK